MGRALGLLPLLVNGSFVRLGQRGLLSWAHRETLGLLLGGDRDALRLLMGGDRHHLGLVADDELFTLLVEDFAPFAKVDGKQPMQQRRMMIKGRKT